MIKKEDQKIFNILSKRFLAFVPVFYGQDRWGDYKQLVEIHDKLSRDKLSESDFKYYVGLFSRDLYAYSNNLKIKR